MKCYHCKDFLHKLVHHEGTFKEFQSVYTIKDAVFNIAHSWDSGKKKTFAAWRKLSSTVMFAENASDKEGFMGFNVCNRDTGHEMVSSFNKLDPSNPECEVSWPEVEEWIGADKKI